MDCRVKPGNDGGELSRADDSSRRRLADTFQEPRRIGGIERTKAGNAVGRGEVPGILRQSGADIVRSRDSAARYACARRSRHGERGRSSAWLGIAWVSPALRSEERRVGKEWRSGWCAWR